MTPELVLLVLAVVTALAFDFTNGFHDTANAMATSIATKALTPKVAVALCAVLNLIGAFLSVEVALTVTNAVIRIQNPDGSPRTELLTDGGRPLLLILLAGLIGAIVWNLFTWLRGLPSSSSHAMFGGLIGATIAGLGVNGVKWAGEGAKLDGVVGKIILPGLASPLIAVLVATVGTWLVFRIARGVPEKVMDKGFRWGQVGTASLVSLAHGANDAQKTMGVITLVLIASGHWVDTHAIPLWVKVACAGAIATGTWLGGWRIIRTMGKGLVEISSPQGMAAEASSAAVILSSSQLGFALSTTHVATGSRRGAGRGPPPPGGGGGARRRGPGGGVTRPCAGLVGAVMWWIGTSLGPWLGPIAIFMILVVLALWMWLHSRIQPIGHHNVNDDWEPEDRSTTVPLTQELVR